MVEEWRDIPGFEGRYQASNLGRIRGVVSGKIKDTVVKKGYLSVGLRVGEQQVRLYQVHRLVASAFFGPSNFEVDHIDCDHMNNRLDNLEYVTRRENYLRAVRTGVCECPKSVMRSDGKTYESIRQCARDNGCQTVDIRKVLTGKQKTLHGFTFKRCACLVA